MQPWDCLAGFRLVSEAGGAVGGSLDGGSFEKGGAVLAATPAIAEGIGTAAGILAALKARRTGST